MSPRMTSGADGAKLSSCVRLLSAGGAQSSRQTRRPRSCRRGTHSARKTWRRPRRRRSTAPWTSAAGRRYCYLYLWLDDQQRDAHARTYGGMCWSQGSMRMSGASRKPVRSLLQMSSLVSAAAPGCMPTQLHPYVLTFGGHRQRGLETAQAAKAYVSICCEGDPAANCCTTAGQRR